ncbi:MAG: DUF692 domain-containing protein [Candidatus Eremiobacteraeota bacterium]|nr:DUF692 domain-containing protein [Candidatus Eremiobacteraeota bacterium]
MRSIDDVAPAGVGMVLFTRELADVVDRSLLDVVEMEPQLYWMRPGDATRPVHANEEFPRHVASLGIPTLLHSVGLPVANAVAPPAHDLERLARDAAILNPLWVSEHLSYDRAVVRGAPVWTGFLLPPPQTHACVRVAAARLRALRDAVERPVAFETGTNYFDDARDELADGAFFAAVAEAADCGILLDLHNLWANERNGRAPLEQVVDALPLDRVWEVHLAGGQMHRGAYLDAHRGLVDPELMTIAARIVPRLPALRAIVLEAIPDSLSGVSPQALRTQLEALHELWSLRGTAARATRRSVTVPDLEPVRAGDARELAAHANSVTGTIVDALVAVDGDRVALVAELVRQARGSALLRVLPFTVRLLMAELGVEAFTALFERYAATNAPERFPLVEAQGFLAFVEREALDVRYLRAIVELERTIVTSVAASTQHAVRFPVAPGPLFTALLERRRPPALPPSPHVLRVGPGGVRIRRARIS